MKEALEMQIQSRWRRSPGGGSGNPLQYPRLENPRDRGAWQATVFGITESDMTEATEHAHTDTQQVLSTFMSSFSYMHRYIDLTDETVTMRQKERSGNMLSRL